MAIDFETLKARISACRQEMEATRDVETLKAALDALALIKVRVQNEGINHEGLEFGKYSEGYRKYRERHNLTAAPYPVVNFKRTTEMWNDTQATVTANGKGVTVVTILPSDQFNIDKLRWNVDRFGPILRLTPDEIETIRGTIAERYIKLFDKYGLLL